MGTAVLLVAAYLLGSMPFGYWAVRLFHGEDVRTMGSGNIGASNVWRAYGWRLGLPIVLLDVAKGFVPALVGILLFDDLRGVLAGGAAMAGHYRPLFLGFAKGGKTVATAAGVFFAVAPLVGLTAAAVWLLCFVVFRYASLASILAALAMPIVAWLYDEPWPTVVFAALAAVAVLLLHRPNIGRLRRGEEPRAQLRRRGSPAPPATT
jgi:acyl phosphate:glycerol-3-phosphate acyltransferase